mgnify:CR=1 FL=1
MQGLQIWVNLPKKDKKVRPGYQHIHKDKIPTVQLEEKNVNIKVLVGEVLGQSSSVNTYSPVSILDIQFTKPNQFSLSVPSEQIAMVYKKYLKESIAVVTCNKIACADEYQSYNELKELSRKYNASFLYLVEEIWN